jgi:hypothetical protein
MLAICEMLDNLGERQKQYKTPLSPFQNAMLEICIDRHSYLFNI